MIDYLTTIYKAIGEENIVSFLDEYEVDLKEYFRTHSIKLIIDEFIKCNNNISLSVLVQDPSGLLQIASLTNAIYLRLAEDDFSDRITMIKKGFKDSLAIQIATIVDKAKPQIIELGKFLKRIANICLGMGDVRIYVLELPIGNSIPSFLLKKVLVSKGKNASLISLSLNRNDSISKGITRKELLKSQIKNLDLDSSLVVYLDEWITGSNFNNILTILSKFSNLKLLPGAFLINESKENEAYSKYKAKFDGIAAKLGLDMDELIVELPTLNHTIVSQQKFIWTEFDRLAGYRKLEFLGSIISTFFAIGEALLDDPKLLNETLKEAIKEHTLLDSETEIPRDLKEKILNSFEYFNSTFVSDIEDRIGSFNIDMSAQFDLEVETAKVISILETTKGYVDSKLAINIIGYYAKNNVINPSSRYFYKGHVPLCLHLEGEEKYLSNLFIAEIEKIIFE